MSNSKENIFGNVNSCFSQFTNQKDHSNFKNQTYYGFNKDKSRCSSSSSSSSQNSQYSYTSSDSCSSSSNSSYSGTCFNCGLNGHFSDVCETIQSKNFYVPFLGNCFKCGKIGHKSESCQNQMSNPKKSFEQKCYNFVEENWDDYLALKSSKVNEEDWDKELALEKQARKEKEQKLAKEKEIIKKISEQQQFEDCQDDLNKYTQIDNKHADLPRSVWTHKEEIQYYVIKKKEIARQFYKKKKKNLDELNSEDINLQAKNEQFEDSIYD